MSDFDAAINTHAGNGTFKRILFRRGQTFTSSSAASIYEDGPGLIGAYGSTGAKPLVNGNSHKLQFGVSSLSGLPLNNDFADWRVVDLNFDAQNQSASGGNIVQAVGPFRGLTFLRVEARNGQNGFLLSEFFLNEINATSSVVPLWSELAIVDSIVENNYNYNFLGGANRFSLMGSLLQGTLGSTGHSMRLGYSNSAVIAHNDLTGASPGNTLTIRGIDSAGNNTIPGPAFTERVIVSDNIISGGESVWFFTIRRVNDGDDARFRDIVVERNWLIATPTTLTMLVTDAGELTIRNNLLNLSGAAGFSAIVLGKSSGTPVGVNNNINVLNNTAFSGTTANSDLNLVSIVNGAPTNLRVQNNLSYAPNLNGTHSDVAGGVGSGTISNNTDGASIQTSNPVFDNPALTQPSFWRATGGSVVNQGANVPVWSDFFVAPRTGTYDLGAVNP